MAYAAASHPRPGERSDLDFVKAYLPYVHRGRKVGFLTTLAENNFYGWTLREDCRCAAKIYAPVEEPACSREQYRDATAIWLMQTAVDFIVAIDARSGEIPDPGYDALWGRIDAIKQDARFSAVATVPVPTFDATDTIFRPR